MTTLTPQTSPPLDMGGRGGDPHVARSGPAATPPAPAPAGAGTPRRSVIGQDKGIKHGTTAGYKQHLYRKVPACEPCLAANRKDVADRHTRRASEGKQKTAAPAPAPHPAATDRKGAPWGVAHGDTAREPALTYIPYTDELGQAPERRERIKAALTCLLLDEQPGDLIEALGIPGDEACLAHRVARKLTGEVTRA